MMKTRFGNMKQKFCKAAVSILLWLAAGLSLFAGEITVVPGKAVILCPDNAAGKVREGAVELQKHLQLVTGEKIPIRSGSKPQAGVYTFLVGVPDPGAPPLPASEVSRWEIGERAAYFYGDDSAGRRGSLYAVINFLDEQLGIRWIEPGKDGIVYKKSASLKLKTGRYQWVPRLRIRCIRCCELPKTRSAMLKEFDLDRKEHARKTDRTRRWQNRMLMCHRTDEFVFGHAFTRWWGKYGKDHPEYFAVNRHGRRAPETEAKNIYDPVAVGASARTIKMCVSNPGLVKQVAANFRQAKPRPKYVNLCENDDVGGYCRCPACLALDTVKNQDLDSSAADLTDRYLHFVNAVAQELESERINLSWYAYNQTKNPPRREKVPVNAVIGTVPNTLDMDELDRFYRMWKQSGARRFTLRPNYHWILMQTGLPMGLEKFFYDILDTAIRHGAVGADFDSSQCHWSVSGIVDYILFRKMSHPEKSFEELEKEYYSAFGAAAGEVEEFFKYYRHEIFLKRLYPKRAELCSRGRFNNFARGVLWDLDRYYSLEDFDRTDAILARAAQRKLTLEESRRISRLQLGNRHSRLLYIAVTSKGNDKIKASTALLNFRLANRKKVNLDFINLFNSERSTGGVDVDAALSLKNFSGYRNTPLLWIALTDEKDAGLRENWQQLNFADIRKKGFLLPTDSPWERIAKRHTAVPPEVREKMKNYDGVVWYFQQLTIPRSWKGKQIYLCFGAVDESCELFVNGKASGAHPFVKPDDWTTPFALRIDQNINWEIPGQTVAVRVKDSAGCGGIWKRVWLAVK